jgi:2-C-methyl-D-erythritol 4-phosphate cytidylyltransferase
MYSFLLLNGGTGTRSGLGYPKQFHLINGHPMLAYALIAAGMVPEITEVIMNYPEGHEEETRRIANHYLKGKRVEYVPCGGERQDSVRLLLERATNADIILHESARPSIKASWIRKLMAEPQKNVTFALPLSFSVAEIDAGPQRVVRLLNRDKIRNIQLPQKFSKDELLSAHRAAANQNRAFTEDATLCCEMGCSPVHFLDGHTVNIKVTGTDDFFIVEAILKGLDDDK